MRTTRTVRRLLASAITAGALLALPASAFAVDANIDLSSAGSSEAGAARQYTLTVQNPATGGETDPWTSGYLTVSLPDGGTASNVIIAAAGGTATGNEVSGTAFPLVIPAGQFVNGEQVRVTFDVTLPKSHVEASKFDVTAELESDDFSYSDTDTDTVATAISKGGPSDLRVHVTKLGVTGVNGLQNKWVKKDTDVAGEVVVTNMGTGSAHFVNVSLNPRLTGVDSFLSPEFPQPPYTTFAPEIAIGAGACAPASAMVPATSATCEITELAAGASVAIPVTLTKVTHYGSIAIGSSVTKADTGTDEDCGNSYEYNKITDDCDPIEAMDGFGGWVQITDGTTTEPHMGVTTDTTATTNGAEVSFKGDLTAAGIAIPEGSFLVVTASSFKDNTAVGSAYEGDAGVNQSIQNVTVPGATCTNYVNPVTSKKQLDNFVCKLPAIPAGARLAFSVGAKFATSRKNYTTGINASIRTASYMQPGSDTSDSASVILNVDKTTDLSVVAASPALVGANNVTPVDIKVTNNGNTKARSINVTASIPSALGSFDDEEQNAACVIKRMSYAAMKSLECSSGELAAGQTRTMTIWVKAGTKLGSLPLSVSAYPMGDGYDVNPDNDWVIHNLTIVKKSLAPLLGVKAISKPKAAKLAAIGKAGIKTQLVTPGAGTVKVDIAVTPKVAKQLGLIKKAGKKNVVIGTKTVKASKAGKVMVQTKLSLKMKKKVLAAKTNLTFIRVVTVTSTERRNNGASFTQTSNFKVVAKAVKKKK